MGIIGNCTKYKEKSSIEKLFFLLLRKYSKKKDPERKYSRQITKLIKKETASLLINDTASSMHFFLALCV